MPSTSGKQARFMAAAAHDPAFAKKAGIPQSVAKEFNQADKGGGILKRAMEHKGINHSHRPLDRLMRT